jgi:hypothetical protein
MVRIRTVICPSPSRCAGPSLSPHAGRGAWAFFSLAPHGGERGGVRGLRMLLLSLGGG